MRLPRVAPIGAVWILLTIAARAEAEPPPSSPAGSAPASAPALPAGVPASSSSALRGNAESSSAIPRPPAPSRVMTLDEALAYARAHQPSVLAAQARIEAAERDADVPGAAWLPRVGAMAQIVGSTTNNSTTTLLGTGVVDLPRIGGTRVTGDPDWQPYPSTAVGVGVRQQIYDFGRVAAERAAADMRTAVERARATGLALDADFAVKSAYFAVLASLSIADASRAAYERAASHRDLARANVQSGLRPPIELTRAEADVARYEAAMMRADANIHIAETRFAAAVGVPDEELGASPTAAPSSAPLPGLADLVSHADRTPDVLELRARLDAQQAETRRLGAESRPVIAATASISGRAGGATPSAGPTPYGEGWLPAVPNYDAGLVFAWPVLDPIWGRLADASRARERAAAEDERFAVTRQRAAIVAAYREAAVAIQTLGAAERGADAARANWDQAEHRFAVGLGTSVELADAQALRSEADIQLAIARFETARSRAALERSIAEEAP